MLRMWSGTKRYRIAVLVAGVIMAFVAGTAFSAMTGDRPVPMAEAYNIARLRAMEWDRSARLYQMNSVDLEGNLDYQQGTDGRRTKWTLDFVIPGTERHLGIDITNGAVTAVTEFRNPTKWEGYDSFPEIPMGRVLKATKEQGVNPGKTVAFGYHFRLLYIDPVRGVELLVYGERQDGGRKSLRFEPETGQLLD